MLESQSFLEHIKKRLTIINFLKLVQLSYAFFYALRIIFLWLKHQLLSTKYGLHGFNLTRFSTTLTKSDLITHLWILCDPNILCCIFHITSSSYDSKRLLGLWVENVRLWSVKFNEVNVLRLPFANGTRGSIYQKTLNLMKNVTLN